MKTKGTMLRQQVYLWTMIIVLGLSGTAAFAGEKPAFTTENDKASYVTGVDIVRTLVRQGGQLNLDLVIQGIMDGFTGDKLRVNENELQKILTVLQNERKQSVACQVIEFANSHREFCSGGPSYAPESSGRAAERTDGDERMSAALFAATIAPPRAAGQNAPVLSIAQALVPGQALNEQRSPAVMLAAQVPAKTEAPVTIEMSELTRRFGSYWSRSHPH